MKPNPLSDAQRAKILAELRRDVAARQHGYRERALTIFPHVCASCGRAFEGKRLKELTVHHKDHNHHNNPPDGSNWELLCVYCHDHEHEKTLDARHRDGAPSDDLKTAPSIFSPFAGLDQLIKPDDKA
jgi:5-methylcytosine-specific restriction endonuclease McrA